MENCDRGLVPSRNRDRVVERTTRVVREVDWAQDRSDFDHHRLRGRCSASFHVYEDCLAALGAIKSKPCTVTRRGLTPQSTSDAIQRAPSPVVGELEDGRGSRSLFRRERNCRIASWSTRHTTCMTPTYRNSYRPILRHENGRT